MRRYRVLKFCYGWHILTTIARLSSMVEWISELPSMFVYRFTCIWFVGLTLVHTIHCRSSFSLTLVHTIHYRSSFSFVAVGWVIRDLRQSLRTFLYNALTQESESWYVIIQWVDTSLSYYNISWCLERQYPHDRLEISDFIQET